MSLAIVPATAKDAATILALIRELADFEKLLDQVTATEDDLVRTLFGASPSAECRLALWNGEPVGFALFFPTYSTFLGKPGLHLEDLFVRPAHRGRGIGKALLVHLAGLAMERGMGRFEWSVLDWNEPAIRFYRSLGATPLDDWTMYRVTGPALAELARM